MPDKPPFVTGTGIGGLIGALIAGGIALSRLDLSDSGQVQQAIGMIFAGIALGAFVGYSAGPKQPPNEPGEGTKT